ncbi:MAG: hypothetical protein EP330_24040 [Deltaproteobacteria bacterium]|nr:MAG: hypothetical protein EP330_24040 [Deltaproteobacteria bacterium]
MTLDARDLRQRLLLLLLSGTASLSYEVVWLRRLGLLLGGTQVAAALTLSAFMGGLALGGLASGRLGRGGERAGLRAYAGLEAAAAAWSVLFPLGYALVASVTPSMPALGWLGAVLLLLPPATALGATWPVLARSLPNRGAAGLYAANTAGALLGVGLSTFVALPWLGVRGTELFAALLGFAAAGVAWRAANAPTREVAVEPLVEVPEVMSTHLSTPVLAMAAAAAGCGAMGLELVWMRLSAVALGSSVQMFGVVLATFLGSVALGAWLGRRFPKDPARGLGQALAAMGLLALCGAMLWGQLPYAVAWTYSVSGPGGVLPASAVLAALAMFGAPVASGMCWSLAVRALGERLEEEAGHLYAANTVGSIAGSLVGGLVAVPLLEITGAVGLFAALPTVAGAAVLRRWWVPLPALALYLFLPAWDAKLFAVGVHLRVSDLADTSPEAVEHFARDGWTLEYYDQGMTAAVAVGRSTRTGNVWLSVNGKVDASTGDDMPTQELSGILPVRMAERASDVLVVGLASGVTAGRVLAEPGVERLTVVEIEPSIVRASHYFDHVNGRPLDDRRTTLIEDDARAVLQRPGPQWDVIVSEPSNPWITGVSNLFTEEYWRLARGRLAEDGVFCQWVQLYGMGPDELRGLVRTFTAVFPDAWVFETIEGSDILLVGGAPRVDRELPLRPILSPEQLRALGGEGWLNTDDRPRVEFRAPYYLHYNTAPANSLLLEEAGRLTP